MSSRHRHGPKVLLAQNAVAQRAAKYVHKKRRNWLVHIQSVFQENRVQSMWAVVTQLGAGGRWRAFLPGPNLGISEQWGQELQNF